jgi:hypothetical protein
MSNTPFLPSTLTLVGSTQNPATTQNSDGSNSTLALGRQGDILVSEVRGKYGLMAHRGYVYWGSTTTAGIALPINTEVTGATNTFGLNNPTGSGVMAELIDFDFMIAGAGPATQNTLGLSVYQASVDAITAITPNPGPITAGGNPSNFGGPAAQCTCFSLATLANTVAVTGAIPLFTFAVSYLPTATYNTGPFHYDFNGKVIIPPGWGVTLTGSAAWASHAIPQLFWAEYKV